MRANNEGDRCANCNDGYADIPCSMEHLQRKNWADILDEYTRYGNQLYHKCLEDLTPTLGRKRAKESARFFKTFNSQITMDIMFNWLLLT